MRFWWALPFGWGKESWVPIKPFLGLSGIVALVFHYHGRHRQTTGMGEGKRDRAHPEFLSQQCSPSPQFQNWPLARVARDLELTPRNPPADAGTQCLCSRLFGREAGCEALRADPLAAAIGDLLVRINAPQKP